MEFSHSSSLTFVLALFLSCCSKPSDQMTKEDEFPSMSIEVGSGAVLSITITNGTKNQISIPSSAKEIYGVYWYKGDTLVNAPECGNGFWDSVITVPAGEVMVFQVPFPRSIAQGQRYTIAVVYSGLGSLTDDAGVKDNSKLDWVRHPDILLSCRKMEATITTPKIKIDNSKSRQSIR